MAHICKAIVRWMLAYSVGLLCALPVNAEQASALFHRALTAEKGDGDLQRALVLYERILVQYRAGEADALLAVRAQERAGAMRTRLGEPPIPDALDSDQVQEAAPLFSFGAFGNFRIERHRDMLDQRVQILRTRLGIRGLPETLSHPDRLQRTALERRIQRLRKALGIRGLPEVIAEAKARYRRTRPEDAMAFYLAGLAMEKGKGDFKTAMVYYDQALRLASEASFQERIQQRLSACRERWHLAE